MREMVSVVPIAGSEEMCVGGGGGWRGTRMVKSVDRLQSGSKLEDLYYGSSLHLFNRAREEVYTEENAKDKRELPAVTRSGDWSFLYPATLVDLSAS